MKDKRSDAMLLCSSVSISCSGDSNVSSFSGASAVSSSACPAGACPGLQPYRGPSFTHPPRCVLQVLNAAYLGTYLSAQTLSLFESNRDLLVLGVA
jgi:hypothetical protein